jgi:hypothetical protein
MAIAAVVLGWLLLFGRLAISTVFGRLAISAIFRWLLFLGGLAISTVFWRLVIFRWLVLGGLAISTVFWRLVIFRWLLFLGGLAISTVFWRLVIFRWLLFLGGLAISTVFWRLVIFRWLFLRGLGRLGRCATTILSRCARRGRCGSRCGGRWGVTSVLSCFAGRARRRSGRRGLRSLAAILAWLAALGGGCGRIVASGRAAASRVGTVTAAWHRIRRRAGGRIDNCLRRGFFDRRFATTLCGRCSRGIGASCLCRRLFDGWVDVTAARRFAARATRAT